MTTPDTDKPLRGRRLSWAEFRKLVGEPLRQANENKSAADHEPRLAPSAASR